MKVVFEYHNFWIRGWLILTVSFTFLKCIENCTYLVSSSFSSEEPLVGLLLVTLYQFRMENV